MRSETAAGVGAHPGAPTLGCLNPESARRRKLARWLGPHGSDGWTLDAGDDVLYVASATSANAVAGVVRHSVLALHMAPMGLVTPSIDPAGQQRPAQPRSQLWRVRFPRARSGNSTRVFKPLPNAGAELITLLGRLRINSTNSSPPQPMGPFPRLNLHESAGLTISQRIGQRSIEAVKGCRSDTQLC